MSGALIGVLTFVMVMYGVLTGAAWMTCYECIKAYEPASTFFWMAIACLLSFGAYVSVASLIHG